MWSQIQLRSIMHRSITKGQGSTFQNIVEGPEDKKANEKIRSAKALYVEGQRPIPVEYEQPTYHTSKGWPSCFWQWAGCNELL